MNASSVRVAWQWTSSGPAPSCFNTTRVTYHPEGGGESSLQLRDPSATETILTGLQSNTCYTITVVATAGEHRRESAAMTVFLPVVQQGIYGQHGKHSLPLKPARNAIIAGPHNHSAAELFTCPFTGPGPTPSTDPGTRPRTSVDPGPRPSPDPGLLAGVAVLVIVLVFAAACILVVLLVVRR